MSGPIRISRWLCVALLCAAPWQAGRASVAKPAGPATTILSPDEEAKMASLLSVFPDTLPKLLEQDMRRRVQRVVLAAGLDESGSNAVQKIADKAVDQCMQTAVSRIRDHLMTRLEDMAPDDRPGLFIGQGGLAATMKEDYVRTIQREAEVWPAEQPAWQAGLKQALTPAQAAAWTAAEAKRTQEVEDQIADYLKGTAAYCAALEKEDIDPEATEARQDTDLPKDRLEKLDAKLDALEKSVDDWAGDGARAMAEKALLGMADDERKAVLGRKHYYNWIPYGGKKKWGEGFAKLFSSDEIKQMRTAKEDRQTRSAHAMAKVMLAMMDNRVAFTAAQRRQLEPIAEHLVIRGDYLTLPDNNGINSVQEDRVFKAAAGDSADEIKSILDPIQWQHWQDVSQLKNLPFNGEQEENEIQLPAEDAASTPAPAPEPEEGERAISDFLAEKSRVEHGQIFTDKMLEAEDAARVLHLPAETAARLKTAARGSADAFMARWNYTTEQTLRSDLGGVTPETMRQRLANFQDYNLGSGCRLDGVASPQESLLEQTIKAELSPAQNLAWKAETDARKAYRADAIAGWIACSFAQSFGLSQDQSAKLQPKIVDAITKYERGMTGFFSYGYWYLEGYYMYLPIAGIPDKDLKAILTAEQLNRWNRSRQCSIVTMYWPNISRIAQAGGN